MWTCPECKRRFVKEGSNHTCKTYKESFLENKPDVIVELYNQLKSLFLSWEGVVAQPNAYGMEVMANRRFAFLVPHKSYVMIGFYLARPVDDFPIENCYQASKKRFSHLIRVGEQVDIDSQLINWLKESYETVGLK